jgi:hypothetical protein
MSWWGAQRGCQLLLSQNNSWSPRWGMMWSTTVAGVMSPVSAHIRQRGFSRRKTFRALSHRAVYPRALGEGRLFLPNRWTLVVIILGRKNSPMIYFGQCPVERPARRPPRSRPSHLAQDLLLALLTPLARLLEPSPWSPEPRPSCPEQRRRTSDLAEVKSQGITHLPIPTPVFPF